MLNRDSHGSELALQLLLYPFLDPARASDSYRDNARGYFVTDDHLRWYWEQYLGDANPAHPYAAPLHGDAADLPPAYIVTAEFDPLRDEGEAYGRHLAAAGVDAEIHRYDGMIHGFMTMSDHLPDGRRANLAAFAALRKALERK
jgi:acetyl esterase